MPQRDSYEPGTPSWVDTSQPDPEAAVEFYSGLFGWEAENAMPEGEQGPYYMCRLQGRNVAAISGQMPEAPPVPVWNTYVTVDDADASAAKATEAGGNVIMDPFDVLDAGRMAVIADPAGAVLSVWQPMQQPGAGIVNEPGAMSWNELATRDPEGSKGFYGELFGWTGSDSDMGGFQYTMWQLPSSPEGSGVGGMIPMAGDQWPEHVPPHWMVYFAVEDTDAAAEKAKELGGKVVVEPFDTPAGKAAVLNDPSGAAFSVIALSQPTQ